MAIKTYPEAPYFDTYTPESEFVQVLAVSGNLSQAREFTEVGSIYRDYLERMGNALFKNGEILSGCDLSLDSDNKLVTLLPGTIYLNGLVRKIREPLQISYAGVGDENIGVKIVETVVTAKTDSSLLNPSVGRDGYGLEGSHRVRQSVSLSRNDEDSVTLYKLKDGRIVVTDLGASTDDDDSYLNDKLAKRTYDVSGNFKVEGLYIENKDNSLLPPTDPDYGKSQVYIGAGKAYVHGYCVKYPHMVVVDCEKPMTTASCLSEPHNILTYDDRFYFNVTPVESIISVDTQVYKELQPIVRSTDGSDYDDTEISSITQITSIMQDGREFEEEVDWVLDGQTIHWINPMEDHHPETGTTYYINYIFIHTNVEGTDYMVGDDPVSGKYIQFLSSSLDLPILPSQFTIDYNYYLSRKDTFLLDSKGKITILKGVPAKKDKCIAPENNDPTKLTLGYVLQLANSCDKEIENVYTIRLTQSQIYALKERIDNLDYSMAVMDLDREASEDEMATDLDGVYTDGFLGYSKSDIWHPEWYGFIDLDQHEFVPPVETFISNLTVDETNSNCSVLGRVISSPYVEKLALSQPKATTEMLVNPYAVWKDLSLLKLDPAQDVWMSNENIIIDGGDEYRNGGALDGFKTYQYWIEYFRNKGFEVDTSGRKANDDKHGKIAYVSDTKTSSTSTTVVATKMRGRKVKISAINFDPLEFPIKLLANFVEYPVTVPAPGPEGYWRDTTSGYTIDIYPKGSSEACPTAVNFVDGSTAVPGNSYIRASETGEVEAYFEIPDGVIPSGSIEVKLLGPFSSCSAVYTSEGTVIRTETTVRKIWTVRTLQDPMAQTFAFDSDQVLTSVDLYFAVKDPNRSVVLQIRNVENGYPGSTIYDEVSISPEDIDASDTIPRPTNVKLSQTVYCFGGVSYALVVISDSNVYRHWVAQIGGTDVVTGVKVASNPYLDGVLFSSSNGSAWTPHQDADMTFRLYTAQYTGGDGDIIFEDVDLVQASGIMTACFFEDNIGDGVDWYYRLDSAADWTPIDPVTIKDLPSIATKCALRCVMHCSRTTSPIIASDSTMLVWHTNKMNGCYVSRLVEMTKAFSSIKVVCYLALPAGCSASVWYTVDDVNWVNMGSPTIKKENFEFDRYTYSSNLSGTASKYRVKVQLSSTNPLNKPRLKKLMSILNF